MYPFISLGIYHSVQETEVFWLDDYTAKTPKTLFHMCKSMVKKYLAQDNDDILREMYLAQDNDDILREMLNTCNDILMSLDDHVHVDMSLNLLWTNALIDIIWTIDPDATCSGIRHHVQEYFFNWTTYTRTYSPKYGGLRPAVLKLQRAWRRA